jgi:hypothetical protein
MFSQMLPDKTNNYTAINTIIPLQEKPRNLLKMLIRRAKKIVKSVHPFHWFDGFMDGIKIDLKEFE